MSNHRSVYPGLCPTDCLACIEAEERGTVHLTELDDERNWPTHEPTSPERHEFHLLDTFTAYCICGWTCTEYSTTDPPNLITPRVAQQYRDHLG